MLISYNACYNYYGIQYDGGRTRFKHQSKLYFNYDFFFVTNVYDCGLIVEQKR